MMVVEGQGDMVEEEMVDILQDHRRHMTIRPAAGLGINLLMDRVGGRVSGLERWVAQLWDMKWEDETREDSSGQVHRALDATTTTIPAKEVLDLQVSQRQPPAPVSDQPDAVEPS